MNSTQQNYESEIPARMALHTTLDSITNNGIRKTHSNISDDETENPTEESTDDSQNFASAADTISVAGSSGSMSPTPQTPSSASSSDEASGFELSTGRSSSGSSVHRLKAYREQRRANLRGGVFPNKSGHSSAGSKLLSPRSLKNSASDRLRQRVSLRTMNRTSGTSPKRTSGTSSKRALNRNSQVQSMRNLTPRSSATTTTLRNSGSGMSSHDSSSSLGSRRSATTTTLRNSDSGISSHSRSNSLGSGRKNRQSWSYSEHSRSGQRRASRRMPTLSNHSKSRRSRKISTSDATKLDISNSSVKDTTLELLNLIKRRRHARATRRSATTSLSPRRQSTRHSTSSSPHVSRRSKLMANDKFRRRSSCTGISLTMDDDEKTSISEEVSGKSSHNSKDTFDLDDTSFYSSSVNSFHEDADAVDPNGDSEANLPEGSDDESHESPKSIMEFPNDRIGVKSEAVPKRKASEAVDAQQKEKMNRMHSELEGLQQQLQQMEQRKATEMKELKEFMQEKRNALTESAKKKLGKHLESELELRVVAADVERERIEESKDVLHKKKEELQDSVAETKSNICELGKENERLEAENKEIYRMHTHLTKWVKKTTKHNENLEIAEAKLKKFYTGSIALMAEERLASLYRRCIYKVAHGVNASDVFDYRLNEEIWKGIEEVEAECNKEVISLSELNDWDEELEQKADARADFISLDEGSEGSESISTSLWRSARSDSSLLDDIEEGSEGSGSLSTSLRRSVRNESGFLDDIEEGKMGEEEDYESETENDEEFDEEMGKLSDSCVFFENVLAEVSVNLDATQMNMLHENKDMLLSIFRFMDSDGSGDIDAEEFKVAVELLNKRLPQSSHFEESEALFELLDVDGNGTIDLSEFERIFD